MRFVDATDQSIFRGVGAGDWLFNGVPDFFPLFVDGVGVTESMKPPARVRQHIFSYSGCLPQESPATP